MISPLFSPDIISVPPNLSSRISTDAPISSIEGLAEHPVKSIRTVEILTTNFDIPLPLIIETSPFLYFLYVSKNFKFQITANSSNLPHLLNNGNEKRAVKTVL